MTNVLVVAGGSALGGALRYLVAQWVAARGWTGFPWATLAVNVAGCFLILLLATIAASVTVREELRLFLATGILGGLTTYSTFDLEATTLLQDGATARALGYIAATLVACFVAGLLGILAGRAVS